MSGSGGTVIDPSRLEREVAALAAARGGPVLWGPVRREERLSSTQDLLSRLEREGSPEGTVVLAGEQTAGRGRHGRPWHSPAGLGLYLSMLLRPGGEAGQLARWGFAATVGICEALRGAGAPAAIKWPNDILAAGRKLAGILVEGRTSGGRLRGVLVGCGVNLHHRDEDFPAALAGGATSIALAAPGAPADATGLCAAVLDGVARWRALAEAEGFGPVLVRWRALSPMSAGQAVRVSEEGRLWEGVTEGVTEEGALRVRGADGATRELRSAELISIREVGACSS